MTGLDLIKSYMQSDIGWSMNQFIDDFKSDMNGFQEKLSVEPFDIDKEVTKDELIIVTVLVALADYLLQQNNLEIPNWLRLSCFKLKDPFYLTKTYDDTDYIRMLYQTPAPFRTRNLFVKREGLSRI